MKKLALVIGVLLLLAIVLPAAASSTPGPSTKATSNGYLFYGGVKWWSRVIKAYDSKNSGVSGSWKEVDSASGSGFTAMVTSLEVTGNTALVEGIITDPISSAGREVCVKMTDNGDGKGAIDKMTATHYAWNCETDTNFYDFIGTITVVT